MPARIALRPFQTADLDRILEIERASFGREAWDRKLFLEYARACPRLFLVAALGRWVAGYSITCLAPRNAELVSIAVDPRHRGRGLGRAMLDHTLAELRARRLKTWWLMVADGNQTAIDFYLSYGFQRGKRVKGYYGAGRDGWRMRFAV